MTVKTSRLWVYVVPDEPQYVLVSLRKPKLEDGMGWSHPMESSICISEWNALTGIHFICDDYNRLVELEFTQSAGGFNVRVVRDTQHERR